MVVRNQRYARLKWRSLVSVKELLWIRKREARSKNPRRKGKGKSKNASLLRRTRIENERWLIGKRGGIRMFAKWIKWKWVKTLVICFLDGTWT